MGLELADGTSVDAEELSRQFSQAMAAPEPDEEAVPAPPRVSPGQEQDTEAPYGRKADGTPRRSRPGPGRPRVDRTPASPDAKAKPKKDAPADNRTYTQKLSELTEAVWFATSQFPPTKAQAELLWVNRPQLVQGWAVAAEHNRFIASGIDAITSHGTWVAVVAMATLPFAMQSYALWTRPQALEQAGMPSKETLEKTTDARLSGFIEAQNQALAEQQAMAAPDAG